MSTRQAKEKPTRSENVYIGRNYDISYDRKLTFALSNVTCECRYATSLKANANSRTWNWHQAARYTETKTRFDHTSNTKLKKRNWSTYRVRETT